MYDDDILDSTDDDLLAKKKALGKSSRSHRGSSSINDIDKVLGAILNVDTVVETIIVPPEVELLSEVCGLLSPLQQLHLENVHLRAMYVLLDRESDGELTRLSELFMIEQSIVAMRTLSSYFDVIYCAVVNIDHQQRVEAVERFELYIKSLLKFLNYAIPMYTEEYLELCNLYDQQPNASIVQTGTFDKVSPDLYYCFNSAIRGSHYRFGDVSYVRSSIEKAVNIFADNLAAKVKALKPKT